MPELAVAAAAELAAQLADLATEFQRSLPARLAEIELALAGLGNGRDEQALVELRGAVHRLAGAAGTFSQVAVGDAARRLAELLQQLLRAPSAARGGDLRAALQGALANLRAAVAAAVPAVARTAVELPGAPAPRRIFLIDGDTPPAAEIAERLTHYGYQARLFATPDEIVDAVRRMPPDALVFDLGSAGELLDGTLVARLRALAPLPVLVVSARTDIDARLHALRAGCDAYLTRPLDIAALVERLDDLLHKTDHRPARVLVVEDDPITARALLAILGSAGILAEVVGDPGQVLPRMQETLPDLIVMEMQLPGCRGDELVAVIRQVDAWQGVPIVYLSVEIDRDRQLLALEQGGDDFLAKPIDPERLVRVVGARIERARRLRSLMTRDSLTGLLNHARFMEQFEIEATRARRAGAPMSVAMIDIDHFKAVNDNHGHAAGDVVIKSLARLLQQRLRQVDVIGRYGGEEFAVVFPETPRDAARCVLEEIGRVFATLCFRRPEGNFTVSFSAGVASLEENDEPRQLIEAADRALYEAKRLGRQRVEVATAGPGGVA
ncbi:MAG: diguanylate cyclase [Candidatus Accumulibacter sp.]|uniref:diguanylate cyclase n=1 Tax=Accumulibacter sp. TaxID=2053492 RepID=UPI0025F3DE98|nr:diguanylate cyclase [Accumulibacter sp.]MCP5249582.1 diguanylate cyclase [Accumulibacter sp.]